MSAASHAWRGPVVIAAFVVVVAIELIVAGPALLRSLSVLSVARTGWLAAAVALTAASFVALAAGKRSMLAGAGRRLGTADVLAGVLVTNAVHSSTPAGVAASSTYAYRWARERGVDATAAVWQLVASGVLATVTLAGLGAAGALLVGAAVTIGSVTTGAALLVLVVLGSWWLATHPDAAVAVPVRMLRRHPGTRTSRVERRLHGVAADLTRIRPHASTWMAAIACALLNWLFDLGCLAACLAAGGVALPSAGGLALAYTAGMAASGLSLLPFGIGTVDVALVGGLVAAGVGPRAAISGVVLYRVVAVGAPVLSGWALGLRSVRRRHPGPTARSGNRGGSDAARRATSSSALVEPADGADPREDAKEEATPVTVTRKGDPPREPVRECSPTPTARCDR
jgi:uncharacterized protein (TIRG00374 family)